MVSRKQDWRLVVSFIEPAVSRIRSLFPDEGRSGPAILLVAGSFVFLRGAAGRQCDLSLEVSAKTLIAACRVLFAVD